MEKREVSTEPMGACERIYKTVAQNCPFRSIHRRSKIAMSENGEVSPNHPGGRTGDSPSKTHFFLRKLVAPYKTHPGQVIIPIEPGPSVMMKEKEKRANPSVSDQQQNSRVIVISTPTTQAGKHSTTKGDKTGTPAKNRATKPAIATVIQESEKLKTTVASGNAQLLNVEEKPMKKTESKIPPSNIIVIQSPGQGTKAIAKPHMPAQGLQPKSQPAPSVGKVMANQDVPGNVGGHDHNHTYTAYIERVKNQLITKSNVGAETTTEKPPTRTPAKRDSFNDKISNFITQAQKNMNTTHFGD